MKFFLSLVLVAAGILILQSAFAQLGHSQVPVFPAMIFVDSDTACPAWPSNPTGAPYTLTQAPTPSLSLELFVNGVMWSAGTDYTLSGNNVTLINGQAFHAGDVVACRYRFINWGGGN